MPGSCVDSWRMADVVDETLVEMTYRWADVEAALPSWIIPAPDVLGDDDRIGDRLAAAMETAFRVEARMLEHDVDINGNEYSRFGFEVLFDVWVPSSRSRQDPPLGDQDRRESHQDGVLRQPARRRGPSRVDRYTGRGAGVRTAWPAATQGAHRCGGRARREADSNVPLIERDHYWLTPIEVPFYDALRETALVFAVQPWIQGVESRFRLDLAWSFTTAG